MEYQTCSTSEVRIVCVLQEDEAGPVHDLAEIEAVCRAYCEEVGLAVTIVPGVSVYAGGRAPAVVIYLFNDPRVSPDWIELQKNALALAERVMLCAHQTACSVIMSPGATFRVEQPAASI
jgi:hypothetical protein